MGMIHVVDNIILNTIINHPSKLWDWTERGRILHWCYLFYFMLIPIKWMRRCSSTNYRMWPRYSWLPFGLKPIFCNWSCKHNTQLIEWIHDYRRCQGNEEWIITSDSWADNCNNRSFQERSTRFGTPSPWVLLFWWNRWPPKNSILRPIFKMAAIVYAF